MTFSRRERSRNPGHLPDRRSRPARPIGWIDNTNMGLPSVRRKHGDIGTICIGIICGRPDSWLGDPLRLVNPSASDKTRPGVARRQMKISGGFRKPRFAIKRRRSGFQIRCRVGSIRTRPHPSRSQNLSKPLLRPDGSWSRTFRSCDSRSRPTAGRAQKSPAERAGPLNFEASKGAVSARRPGRISRPCLRSA